MNPYSFFACLSCGGELESVNVGRVVNGAEMAVIARCTSCTREWGLHLRLISVNTKPDESAACGTNRGYAAHLRRGEEACSPCRRAHAQYQQDMKATRTRKVMTGVLS